MSGVRDDFWEKWVGDQSVREFLEYSNQDETVWSAVRDYLIEGAFAEEYWGLPEEEKEELGDNICHTIARASRNPDFECTMTVKTALKKWNKRK